MRFFWVHSYAMLHQIIICHQIVLVLDLLIIPNQLLLHPKVHDFQAMHNNSASKSSSACVVFINQSIIRQFTTYLYLGLYIKNYFFSSIRWPVPFDKYYDSFWWYGNHQQWLQLTEIANNTRETIYDLVPIWSINLFFAIFLILLK